MISVAERCIPGKQNVAEHLARYEFAKQYVIDKKVLDVGCGVGYGSSLLASIAKEVVGIDISKEAIDCAKQTYSKDGVCFHVGDATNLDFLKDKDFDVIISFEVIEHIPDYYKYLKEIRRLLKDDGILIISTPNKKYHSPDSDKPTNPYHVIEFWLDEFEELLRIYFSDVILYGQNYQTAVKRIIRFILPKFKSIIALLLSQTVRNTAFFQNTRDMYYSRGASQFSDKYVVNHSYFMAICK